MMGPFHGPSAADIAKNPPMLGSGARRLAMAAGAIGIAGIALAFLLGNNEADAMRHFYFSYLAAYTFWLSIALGSLFYMLIHFLLRDGSLVVIRRIAENWAGTIPILAILVLPILIPILMGSHELYWWLDPAVRETDALVIHKAGYLNLGFFTVRIIAYFAVWIVLTWIFRSMSLRQDQNGDKNITRRLWSMSAPAMLIFALSITFFAFDMIMALDAHWFSTIFGVYFFAGSMVGTYAVLSLSAVAVQATGKLRLAVTAEHYHDLGKLLFAFLFFWGYIAFSQFLLYWYGNIPEETGWYLRRFDGEWLAVSVALLFMHLLIPFAILLSRFVKRRKLLLGLAAVWMLAAHMLDIYWLVLPEYDSAGVTLGLIDAASWVGIGGITVAVFLWLASAKALVPVRDPNLAESLNFENV